MIVDPDSGGIRSDLRYSHSVGALNRWTGCTLLILGLAIGGWLDPWSLSERDPTRLWDTGRLLARHAQAVVVASAFLQLGVAMILSEAISASGLVCCSAALSATASATYMAGWAAGAIWPEALWLAPSGAAMNLAAIAALLVTLRRQGNTLILQIALAVFCFGMALDLAMALFAIDPTRFVPSRLGGIDSVPMRMLRLARAAVIALTVLTLFVRRLQLREERRSALLHWAEVLLISGAIGMPLLLVLAATFDLRLKYLLGLPAQLVLAGTVIGCFVALRRRAFTAAAGWGLVALSMGVGMMMGLYAFDGPFPAPDLLGRYNDFARRLSRLAHAYWIVQGMTAILLATSTNDGRRISPWRWRLGIGLLTSGVMAMTMAVLFAVASPQAVRFVGVGAVLSAASVASLSTRLSFNAQPEGAGA